MSPPVTGVSLEGFKTTALPTATAGATERFDRCMAKSHGLDDGNDALWFLVHPAFLAWNIARHDMANDTVGSGHGLLHDVQHRLPLNLRFHPYAPGFTARPITDLLFARLHDVISVAEDLGSLTG